jgi:hypothetical protein
MNLLWGQISYGEPPADEKVVRQTQTPYDQNKPAAVMDDMPVQQEYESDSDPSLGLATRQLASAWHPGKTSPPEWIPQVDGVTESQAVINRQVSSSGTAAHREASGQVRPNMSYAVGIEPVADLNGAAFGNEYFVRHERDVQEGMGDQMTVPPGYDHQSQAAIAARGAKQSREAYQASLYTLYWNGGK